jgi:hypothetical protein
MGSNVPGEVRRTVIKYSHGREAVVSRNLNCRAPKVRLKSPYHSAEECRPCGPRFYLGALDPRPYGRGY